MILRLACLDENQLLDFVEDRLSAETRSAAVAHADECPSCAELIARALDALHPTPASDGAAPDGRRVPMELDKWKRFRLVGLIGAGGAGDVYKAYDPELRRIVAVKILRGGDQRFLIEAQAQARVEHDNVCKVYEVGKVNDRPFIAMQYIDGQTLSAAAAEMPLEDRVRVMARVADAIDAAHQIDIIHRDLKPSNILVEKSAAGWKPYVMDFGLARVISETGRTITGTLVGTPQYMAPEQARGEVSRLDRRTDVYGLGATLYSVLLGQPPFAGPATADLLLRIVQDEPTPPRRLLPTLPRDLENVMLKALEKEPSLRYPSAAALARDLDAFLRGEPVTARPQAPLARMWRKAMKHGRLVTLGGLGLVAITASLAVAIGTVRSSTKRCHGFERLLEGTWDASRRAEVAAAFGRVKAPYAAAALESVEHALDHYAAALVSEQTSACEATRMRGDQSEELLDLRTQCLDDRRRELSALVEVLAHADTGAVERAPRAAGRLDDIAECRDIAELRAPVKPPPTADRGCVAAVRDALARAKALENAAEYPAALALSTTAVADARALGYRPLEAQALDRKGLLQLETEDAPSAEQTLTDAALAAEAGRDERTVFSARLHLLQAITDISARYSEAPRYIRLAEAALEQLGSGDDLHAELLNREAILAMRLGKDDDARKKLVEAHALDVAHYGPDAIETARTEHNLALIESELGHYEEELTLARHTLAVNEKLYGPDHPEVASELMQIGNALDDCGRHDEALATHRRARVILERIGSDRPDLARVLTNEAIDLEHLHRAAEAVPVISRAIEIGQQVLGENNPDVAVMYHQLADDYDQLGRYAESLTANHRALAIETKAVGPDGGDTFYPIYGTAETLLKLGRTREAKAEYRRALAIVDKSELPPVDRGNARFGLAQAMVAAGDPLGPARELTIAARTFFVTAGPGAAPHVSEVDAWLRTHPARAH